jgi:hypothetical protein
MAEQETLHDERDAFDPLAHSLWNRFVDNAMVVHQAWLRACAEGGSVGTCRLCGAYLKPSYPDQVGQRHDYEAACVSCGHIVVAPGGRVLARSARLHERPGGQ